MTKKQKLIHLYREAVVYRDKRFPLLKKTRYEKLIERNKDLFNKV